METALTVPQLTVDVHGSENAATDQTASVAAWNVPNMTAAHPQAAEIVRQIDHYFCDDNLRQDAHLLGLFKAGNGTVSLNEVLGFKKMRPFTPKSKVREAIEQSTVVEIVKVGKKDRLRRRQPLQKSITVIPKINDNIQRFTVPEDKPWLTKELMKPTGFEEYATSGPIDPKEFEEDRREYDPDNCFTERIEIAVRKFCARRKMHQETRLIFEKYMLYGGMECNTNPFTGGLGSLQRDEMTKKEMAEMNSRYCVSERILDGLFEDEDPNKKPTYVVDFEKSAKGFMSDQFPQICNWYDGKQVMTATNVLRNFYNYLLLHDVCPEYTHQLHAARKVCDLAEEELLTLAIIDRRLPSGFDKACSTLFEGNYAALNASPEDEWFVEGDDIGWTKEDAKTVFLTGMFAYGTEEQLEKIESMNDNGEDISKSIKEIQANEEEGMGLEVIAVERVTEAALKIYDDVRFNNTFVKPIGKLRCKRWDVPQGKRWDLPNEEWERRAKITEVEFLIDDETLQYCFPGMKMEACVKELDIGIKFIDYYEAIYVSFFTFLWNDRIREYKEPGPPLPWMERINARIRGDAVEKFVGDGDELGEDGPDEEEMPD